MGVSNEQKEELLSIFRDILRCPTLSLETDLFSFGLTSIMCAQAAVAGAERGLDLGLLTIYRCRSVDKISAEVGTFRDMADAKREDIPDHASRRFPVTPTAIFLHEAGFDTHYNICGLWDYDSGLNLSRLADAVSQVLQVHSSLRVRIERKSRARLARFVSALLPLAPLEIVDLSSMPVAGQGLEVERCAAELQRSFRFDAETSLMRFVAFDTGGGAGHLLILAHHFVVDGFGFSLLLRELERAYQCCERGEPFTSVANRASHPEQWVARLAKYAADEAPAEAQFWRSLPWHAFHAPTLPPPTLDDPTPTYSAESAKALHHGLSDGVYHLDQRQVGADMAVARVALGPATTRGLLQLPDGDQLDVALLAIGRAVISITGSQNLWIDTFNAARGLLFDDSDSSRTIGYVNEIVPIPLNVPLDAAPALALEEIRIQRLSVPRAGLGFRAMKYCATDRSIQGEARNWPSPIFGLNYLVPVQRNSPRRLLQLKRSSLWPGAEIDESRTPYQICFIFFVDGGTVCLDTRHHPSISHGVALRFADEVTRSLASLVESFSRRGESDNEQRVSALHK